MGRSRGRMIRLVNGPYDGLYVSVSPRQNRVRMVSPLADIVKERYPYWADVKHSYGRITKHVFAYEGIESEIPDA